MSIWSRIKKRFSPKPKAKVTPAKRPISVPTKKTPLPDPFNREKPFGSNLPSGVQKSPSTPSKPVPVSPVRSGGGGSSGGGGEGGGGGGSSPTTQTLPAPFDPTNALGAGIPTAPLNERTSQAPGDFAGSGAGSGVDEQIGQRLQEFGMSQESTAGQRLSGALSLVPGGLATKAAAQAARNTLLKSNLDDAARKTLQLIEGKGLEGLVKIALTKSGKAPIGKSTINTKTMRLTLNYLKKLVWGAKNPRVVLGLLISSLTVGGGAALFSKTMIPNAQGDTIQSINIALGKAVSAGDLEEAEYLNNLLTDMESSMEDANTGLSSYSPFEYAKTEIDKVKAGKEVADSQIKILKNQREREAQEIKDREERDARYDQIRQEDIQKDQERDAMFQQLEIERQQAAADRDAKTEARIEKQIKDEQKRWKKRQKEIEARDELLRQQRVAEFDARVAEFNRQQAVYMANWEKRQKAYENERGSNLAFGLLG